MIAWLTWYEDPVLWGLVFVVLFILSWLRDKFDN